MVLTRNNMVLIILDTFLPVCELFDSHEKRYVGCHYVVFPRHITMALTNIIA